MKIKKILVYFGLFISPFTFCQTNSYKSELEKFFKDINYSYNEDSFTHDYSNNWDIDGDFVKDSILFIGNNAVNLNYKLRIILSSDNKVRDFPFLIIDNPLLEKVSKLKKCSYFPAPNYLPRFIVYDFDSDGIEEIYLYISKVYSDHFKNELTNLSICSNVILIDFDNNQLNISDFLK